MASTTERLAAKYDDAQCLSQRVPSFQPHPVAVATDALGLPTNPSIALIDGAMWMLVRVLNYVIEYDAEGRARYRHLERLPDGRPLLRTRNLILRLDDEYRPLDSAMVAPPVGWPAPSFPNILGFEDSRLFVWRGAPWCVSSIRETYGDGIGRMILARIDGLGSPAPRLAAARLLDPGGTPRNEKNWMPLVDGDALRFVYTLDPMRVLDERGRTVAEYPRRYALEDRMRGGTPLVPFEGGWLGMEHELIRDGYAFCYYHRFVWLDARYALRRLSRRFFFTMTGVEFAAGLCWSPDAARLVVSFGVNDCSCHIGMLDPDEVSAVLGDAEPDFAGSVSFIHGASSQS
jgi:hypothetical protein